MQNNYHINLLQIILTEKYLKIDNGYKHIQNITF